MRRMLWAGLVLLSTGGLVFGQDEPKPDQLRKMYDGTLVQLKQAQDRKNELAAENEKLNAKLVDLQKQLDAMKARDDELNRQAAGYAEKTFVMRSQYAAWQEFIHRYPKLEQAWKMYLSGDTLPPGELSAYIDKDWPLSAAKD